MGIVRRVFESVNIKLDLNFLQIKFFTSFRKRNWNHWSESEYEDEKSKV